MKINAKAVYTCVKMYLYIMFLQRILKLSSPKSIVFIIILNSKQRMVSHRMCIQKGRD